SMNFYPAPPLSLNFYAALIERRLFPHFGQFAITGSQPYLRGTFATSPRNPAAEQYREVFTDTMPDRIHKYTKNVAFFD
ncbi:MAG: hypothetical protein KDI14_17710, partial [Halioglobus sp.]|nr:hypothetical protein [Halioglobus sp.]